MSLLHVGRYASLILVLLGNGLAVEAVDATAPMELRHNMPFVQVMVNQQGPFTFGIDTGTGGESLVSPDLARKLHLPSVGEATVGDPSGSNAQRVPLFRIESLTVAGITFRNITGVQYQPSPREGECDGVLGFTLFRDYLLTLDYPRKQLVLSSGSLAQDGNGNVVSFSMPDNVPLIELQIGGRRIGAHIDSRGMGLSLPQSFAKDLKFVSDPIVLGRGRTVSSDFEIKGAQLASDIELAGYTFARPFIEINPVFPVANFGAIPLQNFAVTFDQKNGLVRFVAKDRTIMIAPPRMMPAPPSQSEAATQPKS